MAEFVLEHWQLIASLVLALLNLVITLCVHHVSSARIKDGSYAVNSSQVTDSLKALLESSSAILEVLNEKKDQ